MKWFGARRAQPRQPEGVRLVRQSGQVVPLELCFAGRNEYGLAQWMIATAVRVLPGDRLLIDLMPARTAVLFSAPKEADQ